MVLESVEVSLGKRSYPIHIGRDLAEQLGKLVQEDLSKGRKLAVITDSNVAGQQGPFLESAFGDLPMLVLPAGESTKAFPQLHTCCDFLAESGLDRFGRVFAVGGGVIGDLAGFAAASFFRGIDFYQVPTTVLSMVDSSVGGKTGINLDCGKNLVGAFHQPLAVYADLDTLKSLPDREFNSGMAEVIKHGMLADKELFKELENAPRLTAESDYLPAIIKRNCEIKSEVVSADEEERKSQGGRALLNLGHTFGHAIEAVAGYGTYLHGEAIAVGLVLAAKLSRELGLVDDSVVDRVGNVVKKYDMPARLESALPLEELLAASRKDKKAQAGKLRYVVMEELGRAVTREGIPETLTRELWLSAGAVDG